LTLRGGARTVIMNGMRRLTAGFVLLALAAGARASGEPTFLEPVTSMEFVLVGPGTFLRGDESGRGRKNERPARPVAVPAVYVGKHEVTVAQFDRFVRETGYVTAAEKRGWVVDVDPAMGKFSRREGITWKNPGFEQTGGHPVVWVDWNDANAFVQWLSGRTGRKMRLPAEAEWEFAAKGGRPSRVWAGTSTEGELGAFAWYDANSGGVPHPVGTKKAGDHGLHDMSGNVWEWCADPYETYRAPAGAMKDPAGSPGSFRVLRGGSWRVGASVATTTYRNGYKPDYSHSSIGFRLVFEPAGGGTQSLP